MNWFYAQNGQQAGPIADEELAHLVQSGVITPATLVWHSGLASWQPYSAISATLPATVGALSGSGGGSLAPAGSQSMCSQCGGVFPADEVVRVGDHDVCARCKPLLLQKIQQGVANVGVFGVQGTRYAGFWIRFAAAILDGLILFLPNLLLNYLFTLTMSTVFHRPTLDAQHPQINSEVLAGLGMYYVVLFTVTSIYNGFCFSRFGGLPGMLICGLRVIRPDGQRVSFLRGAARYFANILNVVILFTGYLFIVFDDQKRALHDYICDTRVVYK